MNFLEAQIYVEGNITVRSNTEESRYLLGLYNTQTKDKRILFMVGLAQQWSAIVTDFETTDMGSDGIVHTFKIRGVRD